MSKAVVIGGSLSGLFAGALLRTIGWEVDVYERSPHVLESRGGGIVLQPEVEELFRRLGVDPGGIPGVWTHERVALADDGGVAHRFDLAQQQTSWTTLYRILRRIFPADHYHQGVALLSARQTGQQVAAIMDDGAVLEADLLIGADGAHSTVRHLFMPDTKFHYAGYVAWRGLVPEKLVDAATTEVLADRFVFYDYPGSHILCYPVANEHLSVESGNRDYSWVWYTVANPQTELPTILTDRFGVRHQSAVPPGELAAGVELQMRALADEWMCRPMRSLISATSQPFVHAVGDLSSYRMVHGRVCLIGEAAFAARPHTASSTSKAAANALGLIHSLQHDPHIDAALRHWEPTQLKIGQALVDYGKKLWQGNTSALRVPAGAAEQAGG